MPWTLRIRHIVLEGSGDATLIIANRTDYFRIVERRAILVDGGLGQEVDILRKVLVEELDNDALNAIVVTHYDQDHMGGISNLLLGDPHIRDRVRLYDQGKYQYFKATTASSRHPSKAEAIQTPKEDPIDTYMKRAKNQESDGSIRYITEKVLSLQSNVNLDLNLFDLGYRSANDLLDREILWGQEDGGRMPPEGAPQVTVVAVNTWVKTSAFESATFPSSCLSTSDAKAKNSRSIGLLITFGRFRYFVGGDLLNTQENPLANYLHPLDILRTSHHGSDESSSEFFLNATKPKVAIISCGWGVKTKDNTFPPSQTAIRRMALEESVKNVFLTNNPWSTQHDIWSGYKFKEPTEDRYKDFLAQIKLKEKIKIQEKSDEINDIVASVSEGQASPYGGGRSRFEVTYLRKEQYGPTPANFTKHFD